MVTKLDVFEYLYAKGACVQAQEVVREFKKSSQDYNQIYNMLIDLQRKGFLQKNKYGFQANKNAKNDLLHNIILYCIKNDMNYNQLIDKNIAGFMSKAFLKKRMSVKDSGLNPRTFSKYVSLLHRNGLALILSRKPLRVTVPYNSFLGDIARYFGIRVFVTQQRAEDYYEEITKELRKFRQLRSKNEIRYNNNIEEYDIRFIHHSLSIEGNPITLPDTRKLLKDKIVPKEYRTESVQEVQNYRKALSAMSKDATEKRMLTLPTILNYHQIAMAHKPEFAGKLRNRKVHIRGNPDYEVARVKDIRTRLEDLMRRYNDFSTQKKSTIQEILGFAAFFHNEFQHIHPFIDGNSRTTRLITFHLLRMQDIPVLDIPIGMLEEYVHTTKGAKKRDDTKLTNTLQHIILHNLRTLNERLT